MISSVTVPHSSREADLAVAVFPFVLLLHQQQLASEPKVGESMITLVATFGAPQEAGSPGLDGKAFRFPFTAIDAQYIGTPRQSSNLMQGRITVEAAGSLLAVWGVSGSDLVKALFQVAKEHITSLLRHSDTIAGDIKLSIGSYTHPGPCPFDIGLIEEPEGATVQLEISRSIGFL